MRYKRDMDILQLCVHVCVFVCVCVLVELCVSICGVVSLSLGECVHV